MRKINKLKVGIALKENENTISRFKYIVNSYTKDEEIINEQITKCSSIIETKTTVYELILIKRDFQRCIRFHKIFYENCDIDFLNEVLVPMTVIGENSLALIIL